MFPAGKVKVSLLLIKPEFQPPFWQKKRSHEGYRTTVTSPDLREAVEVKL